MDGQDKQRRANRALTQRYDIHALKKINAIEDEFRMELSEMYGCDPDDVPINLDILEIYNQDAFQRKETLDDLLKDAPKDTTATKKKLLDQLEQLQIVPISTKK